MKIALKPTVLLNNQPKYILPEEYDFQVVDSTLEKTTVYVNLDSNSEWSQAFKAFCILNNFNLILKFSPRQSNNVSLVNITYICWHGFKPGRSKNITDTERMTSNRNKKIDCKFQIKISIKKCLPCLLQIYIINSHNHPLESAHILSFNAISEISLKSMYESFNNGLSPSAAKSELEKTLSEDQHIDRSMNPLKADFYRIYYKWLTKKYGMENGPEMLAKIKERVGEFKGELFYSGIFNTYLKKI